MSKDVRLRIYIKITLEFGGKTRLKRAEHEISYIALIPPQRTEPERPLK